MRVSIMGQAAFGEAILARLFADGVEVVGVSAPAPVEGSRSDPLWSAAEAADLPLLPTQFLKTAEGLARWRDLAADLCVMAFVTEIVRDDVLAAPLLGSIQYHPSLLPLHRGSSAINWAIINGDAETGLTIFWPDRGIDTGPILLQKRTPLRFDDTVGSVYFDRLFPLGVDALAESVALVAAGNAPRIEQEHTRATYEPACDETHAAIRWYEDSARLHALIRGCNPQPGAWATYEGERLRFFDSQLTGQPESGMPGRVLRVDEGSFDVRLNGDVLRVLRVQPAGGKKVPAGDWARSAGLKEGFRFR